MKKFLFAIICIFLFKSPCFAAVKNQEKIANVESHINSEHKEHKEHEEYIDEQLSDSEDEEVLEEDNEEYMGKDEVDFDHNN